MAFKFTEKERKYDGKDPTQGKVYRTFDWIWKLFMINTLTLVTCLGIITILPAVTAAFRTLKECYEEDETHYIKKYFYNFRFCFKDTFLLGILGIIIYAVLLYAYIYYNEVITPLPVVLAKGIDYQAQLMKKVAREFNIPIMENVPLAHALYDLAEEGRYSPRELIEPVAKVIRWVREQKEQEETQALLNNLSKN